MNPIQNGAAVAPAPDPFEVAGNRLADVLAGIFHQWQVTFAEHLGPVADRVLNVPEWKIAAISCVLVMGAVVGFRLKKVVSPDRPTQSAYIRGGGAVLAYASLGSLIGFSLLSTSFAGAFAFVGRMDIFRQYFTWHALAEVAGGLGALPLSMYLGHRITRWERGGGLDDVQQLVRSFPKLKTFDPSRYFKVKKGCFIGRDSDLKPIYIPWQKVRETHIQVLGTTGSGKGVFMVSVAVQSLMAGESVVWFSPKFDEFASRLLRDAAEERGVPFVYLDLNYDQPPQFSILSGASERDTAELLVAGFDLLGKGTDGDFHRGRDEDAAMLTAKIAGERGIKSITELVDACAGVEEITEKENFWRCLRKLAGLSVIQTDQGVDLADIIARGGVIYVNGSCDSLPVKMLQKMVLARVAQIIKNRPVMGPKQYVCVGLDEGKHMLSTPVLTSLAVTRSAGAHFLLAHQSMGDLESCANLVPAEVRGAVIDNTSLKIIYRINDPDYAAWLSRLAGMRRTFTESTGKDDGRDGHQGNWREQQVPFLNPDLITHLPVPSDQKGQASAGVLLGSGNAKLFHIGPMRAAGDLPKPVAAPPSKASQKKSAGPI